MNYPDLTSHWLGVLDRAPYMETFDFYYFPLDPPDLLAINALLRDRGVFVPSFAPSDENIYDPLTYRRQEIHHETATHLLADRNLVTRWLSLLADSAPTAEHRVAAAVMAFAQCAGILIEPNMALYEATDFMGKSEANEELQRFRVADNLHPAYWAGVALARSTELAPSADALPNAPPDKGVDFEMPLRRWRRLYILALKIAELELRGGQSDRRMEELLQWMYEEFLISGPAIMLAAHYLAPNSNRKGLLKNLRSPDRDRAIAGVRNAAWDLTLLSEWQARIQAQEERNTLTLLCSLDQKVLEFARALVELTPTPDHLEDAFQSLWGPTTGRRLAAQLKDLMATADNPARQINKPAGQSSVDALIREGESTVCSWRPPNKEPAVRPQPASGFRGT